MDKCAAIKGDGTRCRGIPIHGSEWCVAHHPEYDAARRSGGMKGGRRGGRGRPAPATGELMRLQAKFEQLAEDVLEGRTDKSAAAVVCQLWNGARGCVVEGIRAREQEELVARMDEIEARIGTRNKPRGA